MLAKLSLLAVPLSWGLHVANHAYQLATGFPSGRIRNVFSCLESLHWPGRAPLHHLVRRYHCYQAPGDRLIVFCWELARDVISVLVELVLVAYKLILMIMVKNQESKTEESVPQLIESHGYKVRLARQTNLEYFPLNKFPFTLYILSVFVVHRFIYAFV